MKITSWLVQRLTPSKQTSPGWVEFAQALESYWRANFDGKLESFENVKSIFTADEQAVHSRLADLGVMFESDASTSLETKALALESRRDDIHRKETTQPIEAMVRRSYTGVDARWVPLLAPTGEDYGTRFITEHYAEVSGVNEDDYFLTSRGVVMVGLDSLFESGFTQADFKGAVQRTMRQMKPLHIVYQGEEVYQNGTIPFEYELEQQRFISKKTKVTAPLNEAGWSGADLVAAVHRTSIYTMYADADSVDYSPYFDVMAADVMPLDSRSTDHSRSWPVRSGDLEFSPESLAVSSKESTAASATEMLIGSTSISQSSATMYAEQGQEMVFFDDVPADGWLTDMGAAL